MSKERREERERENEGKKDRLQEEVETVGGIHETQKLLSNI